jgi:hypothetical protein
MRSAANTSLCSLYRYGDGCLSIVIIFIGCEKMLLYYAMLSIGAFFVVVAVFALIVMYRDKDIHYLM